ncbi:hypothetical protein Tco_1385468 [Tanacetum coccineum]
MASLDHRLNPLFSIKECMSYGALYTRNCGCSKESLEDKILVPVPDSSQRPPQNCATCGDPVDGLCCRPCAFVRKCLNECWYTIHDENEILNTFESSNNNTNVMESFVNDVLVSLVGTVLILVIIVHQKLRLSLIQNNAIKPLMSQPQTLPSVHPTCNSGDENSFTYDSKPNSVDDSPNIFNPLPQPSMYSCEFCGNNARYEKNEEERRIAKDQAAKDRYWKIPICYDDDEDYTIAITPILSTKEPVDSLIMEDEHLDTTPTTESDEVIKSSVENLVKIPSEFKGISEDMCDVPVCKDSSTFDALSNHYEILSDSNDDDTSSDDDSYKNIEYIEASPLNLEIVSLEEVNKDQEEKEFDLEDIFQIQDVILQEKLLNISRLVTNIESLKDNLTHDRVLKSPSLFPILIMDSDSFFEESDTSFSYSDNSLPEFEIFSDHTEETRSSSTTTHANYSLPEYDSFLFEIELDQGRLTDIVISDNSNDPLLELPEFESFYFDLYDDPSFPRPPLKPPDVEISLIIETDAPMITF